MKIYTSCKEAIKACFTNERFAIAHLLNGEKTLDMHIHDSYEIYISLSGGKRFFIAESNYEVNKGDVFVINQYESHYLVHQPDVDHERIVISVMPEFIESLSSIETNLATCFNRETTIGHRIMLDNYELSYIQSLINKMSLTEGYGSDLIENTTFIELMIYINRLFIGQNNNETKGVTYSENKLVEGILDYINKNITESFTIETLAKELFISSSYACRLFKRETGITINKYITARKISRAKSMLASGASVKEACAGSGFNDYANFIKSFTKIVGISPKKYGKCNLME